MSEAGESLGKKVSKSWRNVTEFFRPKSEKAKSIEINISSPQGISESVERILREGVDSRVEVLTELLSGLGEGISWATQNLGLSQMPEVAVLQFVGDQPQYRIAGYAGSHKLIFLDTQKLARLKWFPAYEKHNVMQNSTTEEIKLTLRELGQYLGIEETVHFSQDLNGTLRPAVISPNADIASYYRQPQEKEALDLASKFFMEKYGANPLEAIRR